MPCTSFEAFGDLRLVCAELIGTAPIAALRRIAASGRRYSPILRDSGSFDPRGPSREAVACSGLSM
jgi:hypothetical protein